MSEPYIGQIIMFGGNFPIRGFTQCDGQLLPISQHSALFSILGTVYGGDGRTNFGIPDLRGRFPMHFGNGPGLANRSLGQKGGNEKQTLTTAQIPPHNHSVEVQCHTEEADTDEPDTNYISKTPEDFFRENANSTMGPVKQNDVGGGQPFDIQNPFLAINFQMALVGVFPSRN